VLLNKCTHQELFHPAQKSQELGTGATAAGEAAAGGVNQPELDCGYFERSGPAAESG